MDNVSNMSTNYGVLDYRREMKAIPTVGPFRYTAHNRCTYLKAPPRS